MPIPVTCPHCHATLKAPESAAGRKVKCPKCSQPMFVPAADEEPLEAVQAAPPAPSRRLAPLPVDDDEDYERPSRDRRSSRQPIRRGDAVLPLILGIVALSLAALGFGLVFIRSSSFCVITGWSLVGAGLVVGLVGLVFAVQYQAGLPLPIAGSSTSAGLLLLMLLLSLTAWRRSPEAELERALGEMARQVQQKMPRDVGMPFNPPQGQQDVEKMAREFEDQMKRVFEEQLKKGFDGKLPPDAFKGAPNLGPPAVPSGTLQLVGGNAQVAGALNPNEGRDPRRNTPAKLYLVNMTAGRTYQIDHMSPAFDAYLRLESPEGTQVAFNDDAVPGTTLDSRIIYTCPRSGTYRIYATVLHLGQGNFTLRVQER